MLIDPDNEKIVRQALLLYQTQLEAQQLPFDVSGDDDSVIAIEKIIHRIDYILQQ